MEDGKPSKEFKVKFKKSDKKLKKWWIDGRLYCTWWLFIIIGVFIIKLDTPIIDEKYKNFIGLIIIFSSARNFIIDYFLYIFYRAKNYRESLWRTNSTAVGYCESFLYPLAIIVMRWEVIGFWIGLKTALGWKLWYTRGEMGPREREEHNRRLAKTLVGNFLSIMLSVITLLVLNHFLDLNLKCFDGNNYFTSNDAYHHWPK